MYTENMSTNKLLTEYLSIQLKCEQKKIHTIKVYIKINESKMYDTKIKFIQKICMPRKRIRIKCLQI